MNELIPEAYRAQTTAHEKLSRRARAMPQQRRSRLMSLLMGLAPVVIGLGGATWAALSRHL